MFIFPLIIWQKNDCLLVCLWAVSTPLYLFLLLGCQLRPCLHSILFSQLLPFWCPDSRQSSFTEFVIIPVNFPLLLRRKVSIYITKNMSTLVTGRQIHIPKELGVSHIDQFLAWGSPLFVPKIISYTYYTSTPYLWPNMWPINASKQMPSALWRFQ